MLRFVHLCEAVSKTTKKLEKRRLVAEYFAFQPLKTALLAAIFLSGDVYPAFFERTLNVGGALLWQAIQQLTRKSDEEMASAYRKYGDLGAAAHDLWPFDFTGSVLTLPDLAGILDEIAVARGQSAKLERVIALLKQCSALEAKYVVKIISGDLRIGMRESLVEEAIAEAFKQPLAAVRRANMLLGDIGETLRLAAENCLDQARMRLFHPIGFMLATEVKSSTEAIACFKEAQDEQIDAQIEDKYDGIRAQVHCGNGQVHIFSRTQDDVSGSFPELVPVFASSPDAIVLDGEILAWRPQSDQVGAEPDMGSSGSALPFSALQKRLGRKRVSAKMLQEIPVVYVAFDVLYARGELLIELPLRERRPILNEIVSQLMRNAGSVPATSADQASLAFDSSDESPNFPRIIRAPAFRAHTSEEIDDIFDQARARGNEGLMLKNLASSYLPGRRGGAWLKMKRELATLDVVVTAVEYGHGKRAGVLSDYTFAVRGQNGKLLNVGKAYSGLTDTEIREMTDWFLAHTLSDYGHSRLVEPTVVLEVAFNNVMRSERHESGFALRFPRIARLRRDKPASEVDTVQRVEQIYLTQHGARKIS